MTDDSPTRQPILLTMPSFDGTLAAARSLGRKGIPVTMARQGVFDSKAAWSRYVTRRVHSPTVHSTASFMEWLLEFGRSQERHVLYPTSDDLTFLFARHATELSRHFDCFQPGLKSVMALIDKKRLNALAAEVGLLTPATWYPRSLAEVERLAPELPYPILVKPRTQALLRTMVKGAVAGTPEALVRAYEKYIKHNHYEQEILDFDDGIRWPMLQRFDESASQGIYSISGFSSRDGEIACFRASRKVLQRPRRVGIGLCFESAPVEPALRKKVVELMQRAGYHGVFEIEFIASDASCEAWPLIDFNPRFFGQMGFDVLQGMDTPYCAYLAAANETAELARCTQAAENSQPAATCRYAHHVVLSTMLALQTLSRAMSWKETAHWTRWLLSSPKGDFVFQGGDPLPGLIDVVSQWRGYARHPRAFVRTMVLNRT